MSRPIETDGAPLGRPYVTLNFAMSVDGKISTTARHPFRFSSRADRDLMDVLRAKTDAILYGAETVRAEDPPVRIRSGSRRMQREAEGKPAHPMAIVVSRSLDLPVHGRFFRPSDGARLIAIPEDASQERIETLPQTAEIVRFGKGEVDLTALCSHLARTGVRRLLVEGGGAINMGFFSRALVDEIYMTLCPVIIGGRNAPTPVDGAGFKITETVTLDLVESRRIGGELFQHFLVKR
ncbi:MAG: dihydrofolate reductase family protein [candidate division Zixibacteria bacterium]|nr:dihydrofolate reductase family protein [candidate division Zixibacteria bacterium]